MLAGDLFTYAKNYRTNNKYRWLENILRQEAILGRLCTEFGDMELDSDMIDWLKKNGYRLYNDPRGTIIVTWAP